MRIILSLTYVAKLPIDSNKKRIEFKWQMTTLSALAGFISQKAGVNNCNSTKNVTLGSAIRLCILFNYIFLFRFGYMHKVKQKS